MIQLGYNEIMDSKGGPLIDIEGGGGEIFPSIIFLSSKLFFGEAVQEFF